MKANQSIYSALIAISILMIGCSSAHTNISGESVEKFMLPDTAGHVVMSSIYNVPSHSFSSRSRLFITPVLMSDDTIVSEADPIILQGNIYRKKMERLMRLKHIDNPVTDSVYYTGANSDTLIINAVSTFEVPDELTEGSFYAIVSKDGCGMCTGMDTIALGEYSNPSNLVVLEPQMIYLTPEFVIQPKIGEGKGVANLQFAINSSVINTSMGNNAIELAKMLHALEPIVSDSLSTLNSLSIFGMASADGPLALNTKLSTNRAAAARDWLVNQLSLPSADRKVIKTGARPEGWEPVLQAMEADNHPGAAEVRRIVEKYAGQSDDVAEKYIRKLPVWNDIKEKYLQKDRKVEYTYSYTIKSFTDDAEFIEIYHTRPDAFSEDEFIHLTQLLPEGDERIEALETMLKYYPNSNVAITNLAISYINRGEIDRAKRLLTSGTYTSDEGILALASSYMKEGDLQSASQLLANLDSPAAKYNLGLIRLKQNRMSEAYELLAPFGGANAALAAIATGHTEDAERLMNECKDDVSPVAEYVRGYLRSHASQD